MKFTFEEAELINGICADLSAVTPKVVITQLTEAKQNTDDDGLVFIADQAIYKLSTHDPLSVKRLLTDLPIDHNAEY